MNIRTKRLDHRPPCRRVEAGMDFHLYYSQFTQARERLSPWENSRALEFVSDIPMNGTVLSAERIRFYRLTYPPEIQYD